MKVGKEDVDALERNLSQGNWEGHCQDASVDRATVG